MRDLVKLIFPPILSLVIIMLGISFFNTFTSVHIISTGGASYLTGVVYSAYYAGMMVGALYIEKFIHRVGHIRGFSIFASLCATSVMFQSFFSSPYVWILFRFITGVTCAGLFVIIESWLLLLSSPNTRGQILSLYMVALYTAQGLGQFILNSMDLSGMLPFSITVILSTLSIIPVCLMRANSPNTAEAEIINIFYILKRTPLGFVGNFIAGMVLSAFYALGPVYAEKSGFTIFQISLIMGCTIFGGMALQWPLGALSDIMERRKVLTITSLSLFTLSLILFLVPAMPFWLLILLLALFGGFSFTLYPLSITHCCDFFSSAGITAITCACLIIYGIGCIIGPLVAPVAMEITRPSGLFAYTAILAMGLALFGFWQTKSQAPPDTKEPFIPLPTTPKGTELDPRSGENKELRN